MSHHEIRTKKAVERAFQYVLEHPTEAELLEEIIAAELDAEEEARQGSDR